jgi:hypothetical protein
MSLYVREPGVERVSISPYPKRRDDSYITIGRPHTDPADSRRASAPDEVCYADFFRETTALRKSTPRVA